VRWFLFIALAVAAVLFVAWRTGYFSGGDTSGVARIVTNPSRESGIASLQGPPPPLMIAAPRGIQ
jgi:hypothetical protein